MDEAFPGRARQVDPAVIDDDPFWSVVRRRHPDVDVVILPPDAPDGPDAPVDSAAPAVDADALNAVAAGLVAAWREVADLLAELGETDGPGLRWAARADGHALVIEKGVRGLGTDGGGDLLRAVAFRLGERDWRLSAPWMRWGGGRRTCATNRRFSRGEKPS